MVILRQKEFSWINSPNDLKPDNALVVPKLIIKAFELANVGNGIHLHHWLYDKVCADSLRICNDKHIPLQLSVAFATGDDFNNLAQISPINKGTINSNIIRFRSSDEFITYAKKEILNDKVKNVIKYSQLSLRTMLPNDTYKLIFRTIALTLSGQINNSVYDDIWNNLYEIESTDIDYFSFKKLNYKNTCKLFSSLLYQVLGYTNEGISDLNNVLNP